jgi:uncharacterized membrane protein
LLAGSRAAIPAHLRWIASPWVAWAALAAGLASRFAYLGSHDLWFDEIFSVETAIHPYDDLVKRTAVDVHPPLYYLILRPFLLAFGDDPLGVRFPSLLLCLGSAILAWDAVRRAFGALPAGVAALLIAASSNHQFYSAEARPYALAQCCFALAIWSQAALASPTNSDAASAWRRSRLRFALLWGGWTLAVAAGLFTHNLFALAGPFLVGATAYARMRGDVRLWRGALLPAGLGALAAAAYFPWMLVAINQVGLMGDALGWMPLPTAGSALAALAVHPTLMAAQPALAPWFWPYAWLMLATILVGACAARRMARSRERRLVALIVVATLAWYGAAHVISWTVVRVVLPARFAALAWPAMLFCLAPLVAWSLARAALFERRGIRLAAVSIAWLAFGAILVPPVADQALNVSRPTQPQTRTMLMRLTAEPNPPPVFYFFCDDPNVSDTFIFHGESLAKKGVVFASPRLLDELAWGPGTGEGEDAVPGEPPSDVLAIVFDSYSSGSLTLARFEALLGRMTEVRRDGEGLGGWTIIRAKR